MKRASYREAVYWIAMNDGPGDHDALEVEYVQGQLTVGIIADIFGVADERVAKDVVRVRKAERKAERRKATADGVAA